MNSHKRASISLCILLSLLFALFAAPAVLAEDAPLAELHLEKNGLPLDLKLLNLAIEDGELVLTIGIDQITRWRDETPPKLIVATAESPQKYKLDLFTADTVSHLPDSAKNYKMTTKLPFDGMALPERLLVDIGEDEPLVFWPQEDAEAAPGTEKDDSGKTEIGKDDTGKIDFGKDSAAEAPAAKADAELDTIRSLLDEGRLYKAALALEQYSIDHPDRETQYQPLLDELLEQVRKNRPQTGVIERTIQFEGRNEFTVHAQSSDVLVIGRDAKNGQLVRYFIREGDSATIYFPGGKYILSVVGGTLWFDDLNGFGEFGTTILEETEVDMKYSDNGAWVTYSWYEFTA